MYRLFFAVMSLTCAPACSGSGTVVVANGTTTGNTGAGTGGNISRKCPIAATGNGLIPASALPRNLLQKTRSGLRYQVLSAPTSRQKPNAADEVQVHFTGYTQDGNVFDTTLASRTPMRLPLAQATRGWRQSLATMAVGEERRVWMPSELAYDGPPPAGAPTGTLIFDILLVSIASAGG